jgi:hypothetical protein
VAAEGVLGMPGVVLTDDRLAPVADGVAAEQAFNPPSGGAAADQAVAVGGARDVLMGATNPRWRLRAASTGPVGVACRVIGISWKSVKWNGETPPSPDRTPQSASMHGLGDVGP